MQGREHSRRASGPADGVAEEVEVVDMGMSTWSPPGRLAERFSLETRITGFDVEALDGIVGSVDVATYQLESDDIVVAVEASRGTRRVVLSTRSVELVDTTDERVWLDLSRSQVESAPEYRP